MSAEYVACPPLMVRIQKIDISSLDFQTGKSRHVTYVEPTNMFLFMGSISGTVYIFSRESLNFLLMIPFKGGKVSHISVSLDECDVAIASIRGRISIYRIPSNYLQRHNGSPTDTFKHLYDVPHHLNNEITEMSWSSNGKYLFVGDSQGIISQTDVASLDDMKTFPRPPLSRIILKVNWRIVQIDCAFPYLGVGTVGGSYLCDLEKEHFCVIKHLGQDIKAGGLTILSNGKTREILIAEITGHIYECKMDGSIVSYRKVDNPLISHSVNFFDPKLMGIENNDGNDNNSALSPNSTDLNFSPGKMFPTDDGQFIISVSSNRIFIYDSQTYQILVWIEDFNRINSIKVIGNYGFLWYSNKVEVFAITQFQTYGRQLLKSGLSSVLENWINYAMKSIIGCDNEEQSSNNKDAIKIFRHLTSPFDEDDEFCDFVSNHVPFEIIDPEVKIETIQKETYEEKLQRIVKELSQTISNLLKSENAYEKIVYNIFHALQEFYEKLGFQVNIPSNNIFDCESNKSASELTLLKVLGASQNFLKNSQLFQLKWDLSKCSLDQIILQKIIEPVVKFLDQLTISTNCEIFTTFDCCFFSFAKCPKVLEYFQELEIPVNVYLKDALFSDLIVLLLPMVAQEQELFKIINKSLLVSENELSRTFFVWLMTLSFLNDRVHSLPFGSLLRTIQNPQYFDKLAEQILGQIYRQVVNSNQYKNTFANFVNFLILYSKSSQIQRSRDFGVVLSEFPFKRRVKSDLIETINKICTNSPILLKLYYKACLEDGKSIKLCECGFPTDNDSLKGDILPFQRAIEEAVFSILVNMYFENEKCNASKLLKQAHFFAMSRCLVEPYLQSTLSDDILSDKAKINLIIKTGECGALKHLKFNLENLKTLNQLNKYEDDHDTNCSNCGREIKGERPKRLSKSRRVLTKDCLNVWMLDNSGTIERFMKLVQKLNLNSKGEFSLRFYQFLIKRNELKKTKKKEDTGFGDLVSLSNLTCSLFHH